MRILLTGADGFVGRAFRQVYDGHDILALDVKFDPAQDVTRVLPGLTSRFDLVLHCAANVGGRARIDGDPLWVARNLAIDLAVVDFCRRTQPHRTVLFSSSAAYPVHLQDVNWHQKLAETDLDLDDVRSPDASYGWAKVTLEQVARWADIDALILRPFSGFSETQSMDYPWSALASRVRARQDPVDIWSDTTRDWVHIEDVINTVKALLSAGAEGAWNICSGVPTSFSRLAGLMAAHCGYDPDIRVLGKNPGVAWRVGDPTKTHAVYAPRISLEQAIERTFA